jgi:hypothetical protein
MAKPFGQLYIAKTDPLEHLFVYMKIQINAPMYDKYYGYNEINTAI